MATGPNRYRGSMPQYTEQARPSATISPQVPAFVPSRMNLPAGSPVAFGTVVAKEREKFGEALSGLGKVLTDHAIKLQQQKDDNAVIQAENDLRKQMNEVMFNPDTGLAMQKGHNAEDTTLTYDRTADELFNKIMEERMKSDDMRAKFAQRVSPWMNSYRAQVARNEGDEVHAAQLADIEVRHADRRDYAMRTPGAMAFTTLRAGAKQDILDRAKLTGQSAAVEEEYFQKQDSQTFVQMAGVLSKNGDVSGLTALYDAAHNDITGEAEAQVMPLIGKVKIENDVFATFNRLKEQYMNPNGTQNTAAMLQAALKLCGPGATKVERRVVGGQSYADGASLVAAVNGGSWTSEYGGRVHPISGEYKFHAGTDVGADYGEDIICPEDGTVIFAGEKGGYGNAAIVQFPDGTQLLVGHCQDLSVSEGQTITKGALLGHVGSTGNSTGPHVHVEFRDENDNPISPDDAASRIRASRSGGGGGGLTLSSGDAQIDAWINEAASANSVPVNLLSALLKQESGYSSDVVSSRGAIGIAQFMPDTAAAVGIDPWDTYQSITGAAMHLKTLYDSFGSWDLALAAYNAGSGAVQEYGGIPPYEETQNYVANIKAMAGDLSAQGSGSGHWEEVTVSAYNPPFYEALVKMIKEQGQISRAQHDTNVQNAIDTLLQDSRVKNATSYAELSAIVAEAGYSGQDAVTITDGISAPMKLTRADTQHEREEQRYWRGEAERNGREAFATFMLNNPDATMTEIQESGAYKSLSPSQQWSIMKSMGSAGSGVPDANAWYKGQTKAAFDKAIKSNGVSDELWIYAVDIVNEAQAQKGSPLSPDEVTALVQKAAAKRTLEDGWGPFNWGATGTSDLQERASHGIPTQESGGEIVTDDDYADEEDIEG